MKKRTEKYYNEISSIVRSDFVGRIEPEAELFTKFLDSIISLDSGKYEFQREDSDVVVKVDQVTRLQQLKQTKEKLLAIINEEFSKEKAQNFSDEFEAYCDHLNAFINKLPKKRVRQQPASRFKILKEDNWFLTFLKFFKIVAFRISRVPARILNFFRSLFKKKRKPVKYWKHTIPERKLVRWVLRYRLSKLLTDKVWNIRSSINNVLLSTWAVEEKTGLIISGHKKIKKVKSWETAVLEGKDRIEKTLKTCRKEADKHIRDQLIKYEQYSLKIGTFEFPSFLFRERKLKRRLNILDRKYLKEKQGWNNSFYSILEDWKLDLELFITTYQVLIHFEKTKSIYLQKIHECSENILKIKDYINNLNSRIKTAGNNKKTLDHQLARERYTGQKELKLKLVGEARENLINQNLSALINKIETDAEESLNNLSDNHWLAKSRNYDRPISQSQIETISTHELLTFETLPKFQGELNSLRNQLFLKIEKIADEIENISDIILYSLETAETCLEEEDKDHEEALKVASDGLERTQNIIESILESYNYLASDFIKQIESHVNNFTDSILDLTDNESLDNIRLRITKGKAISQSKAFRKRIRDILTEFWYVFLNNTKNKIKDQKETITKLYYKYLGTPPTEIISTEVSDFLIDSFEVVQELPYVYQKLFKVEPLHDPRLFVGREKELEEIKKAYTNWEKGRFASTVVLSEKGAGLSSFINYFNYKLDSPYRVVRLSNSISTDRESDLIHLIAEALDERKVNNMQELINYLESLSNKRIIILENLHNFFIRKVNGFNCLFKLMELISKTNKKVFWIATSNIYSWNYLDRAININDYFQHIISLEDMDDEHIIKIIRNRNKISGYKVIFEVPENYKEDKKFKNMEEEDQQELLKKKYFSRLNKFSKSNLSLAIIYWLQSVKKIEEDKIVIGYFKEPEFTFINTLSREKVFALHALILHDGLTAEQYADIANITIDESKILLYLLLEDGILIMDQDTYLLNPLIYRPMIAMLKAKNLLH